ncbi:ferredoxin [uncultured Acetobacteroides sp.]|uniref:ferredoxin n=1 Tax=uncultured Acetobacteroides sp. TaxID=1760811 RepID=UPI0029F55138|nr:ferredoxin [uncultured Acetobacteroides sp.]
MKKIVLTPIECIGCGTCVDIAPAYFVMDENGKANLFGGRSEKDTIATELFPGDDDVLASVMACCPSRCISVTK